MIIKTDNRAKMEFFNPEIHICDDLSSYLHDFPMIFGDMVGMLADMQFPSVYGDNVFVLTDENNNIADPTS